MASLLSRDMSRAHGVLVLLADGPADLAAARYGARLAAERGTRVLCAVLLPALAVHDRAGLASATVQRRAEAAAVAARVAPTMEARSVVATAVPLLAPASVPRWSTSRLERALRLLARTCGAEVVVVPPVHLLGRPPEALARALPTGVVAPDLAAGAAAGR